MRKFLFSASLLLVVLLGVIVLIETSCNKNTTCVANVTVLDDATSLPVQGALVKIDYPNGKLQGDQGTTDASGKVSIKFKYEAILDVTVTHPKYSKPGVTIIKLEAGKTTEKTVRL
jgi:hypothetical protein